MDHSALSQRSFDRKYRPGRWDCAASSGVRSFHNVRCTSSVSPRFDRYCAVGDFPLEHLMGLDPVGSRRRRVAADHLCGASLRVGVERIGCLGTGQPTASGAVCSLDRAVVIRVVVLGIVFYAMTQGAQFVAIDNQPAATTSLVLSLTRCWSQGWRQDLLPSLRRVGS